jgi:hypothetical protein
MTYGPDTLATIARNQLEAARAKEPLPIVRGTSAVAQAAYALGFQDIVYDLSDKPVSELVYLLRVKEGQWQYVSLCHYEGRFLEAVIEVFHRARDHKARRVGKLRDQQLKGAAPLYCNIARDWATIEAMVGRVYELSAV